VLQQTHWSLHRDIYDWAGQFRTVAPLREHEGIQPQRVVKVSELQRWVGEVMKRIDAESAQPAPLKEQLVERMTITTAQLTFLSPFVKGNSLTRNTLVMSLAQQAGYQLDLNQVRALEVNEATAAAEQMDFSDLRNLIRSHTAPFRALAFSRAKSEPEIAAAVGWHAELWHVYRTIDLARETLRGERQAVIDRHIPRVIRYLQHRLNEGHIPTAPTRESVQDLLMHLVKQRER
jgi:fido (protein-threonine AMPylation protein)